MLIIAIPIGLLIGMSLGALGGGGSILTVPALVSCSTSNLTRPPPGPGACPRPRLRLPAAVGTSLLVIAINNAAALARVRGGSQRAGRCGRLPPRRCGGQRARRDRWPAAPRPARKPHLSRYM